MRTPVSDRPALPETLELPGRQVLVVERNPGDATLRILSPEGEARLTISVTEAGPVLHVEGRAVSIQVSGDLAIESEHLALRGRKGLSLESGGDAHLAAAGDLNTEARIQTHRARLGNVNLEANDDVKLTGERIRLNC